MDALRNANQGLAFGLEIAMLAALGYAGWAATPIGWLRAMLLIGLPVLATVLWAVWAAPRSGRRLAGPALIGFKLALFAVTTAGLWAAGADTAAWLFGGVAVAHLLLAIGLRQV